MPDNYEYTALRDLRVPGTMVYGYRTGDGVPASVVANWELEVGMDVMPRDTGVVARPADDAPRSEWEAYAIGQGMSPEEAHEASLSQLKGIPEPDPEAEPEPLPDPNAPPERPAPDALKADWVEYVLATGADPVWANDKGTTKADLQAYEPKNDETAGNQTIETPPPGDTVAAAASEAQADANENG